MRIIASIGRPSVRERSFSFEKVLAVRFFIAVFRKELGLHILDLSED